jgi:phage-related protein
MSVGDQEEEVPKPVFWVGNSLINLREFPDEVRQAMGFALWQAQTGSKHVNAKPLSGFGGAGVLEIVEVHRGNTFRGVYAVKFAGAVYVLHAFQKKSKRGIKTPPRDVELVRKRLKIAEHHYKEWRLSQSSNENKQ